MQASACSGSPALAANTAVSPSMAAAAASRSACFRELRTTLAPAPARAAAVARPIPRLAPVTTATLPSSRSSMAGGS